MLGIIFRLCLKFNISELNFDMLINSHTKLKNQYIK